MNHEWISFMRSSRSCRSRVCSRFGRWGSRRVLARTELAFNRTKSLQWRQKTFFSDLTGNFRRASSAETVKSAIGSSSSMNASTLFCFRQKHMNSRANEITFNGWVRKIDAKNPVMIEPSHWPTLTLPYCIPRTATKNIETATKRTERT